MEIIVADNAGFCFGVKRALELTEKALETSALYSFGPLIHNTQEVDRLSEMGLKSIEEISDAKNNRVIIRSHGVDRNSLDRLKIESSELIDATCPFVLAVQKKVEKFSIKGYDIMVIGDKSHPEVKGILGWCDPKVRAFAINSINELSELPVLDRVFVVSQTTNIYEKFKAISDELVKLANEVVIENTICNATKIRQESTVELAKKVDAMIVLGGKNSSNSKKLAELSRIHCNNVFFIETINDLSLQELQKFNTIGITAGASTPDWIIKEAVSVMDNYNKDEMMEAIDSSFKRVSRGDVLKGTVLYVTNNEVMVNINYKSDGIIERDELSKDSDVNPKDLYNVGDEIDVYVIKLDDGEGNVVLSAKRVAFIKDWEILEESFNNDQIIEVNVVNAVKGGLTVTANGISGFMPASQVSTVYVSDLSKYKGKNLRAKIIDFDKQKRRMIFSAKVVEKVELEEKRAALWEKLENQDVIEGTVQRLTDFGAFVDIGGVDGLIHISDLAWHRVKHPSDVLKEGQEVEVKVLSYDKEKNRISLGLKQTVEEPWVAFMNEHKIGDVVEGDIVNVLDFGAFVRLRKGVDGLLHVSQISSEHVEKPSDVLKVGEKIQVKITDINVEDKKISLSRRALLEPVPGEKLEDEPIEEKKDEEDEYKPQEFDTSIGELTKED